MSDQYDDESLFKFFVEHGYFPPDYKENKILKKNIEISNKNTLNYSANNKEYREITKDNLINNNYSVSEEERLLFLNAIKNLDCTNHSKKELPKKNIRFKPRLKNVIPKDTLDLHGYKSERALIEVKHFIYECKKNKLSPILIIHGKGFGSENRVPVLKHIVEYYIATEGKVYIKYSIDAPRELGGSGAKLIYLNL